MQQDASDQSQTDPTSDPYSHFNPPQRMVVRTLETANKPFNFVPDQTKDILGLVAVVTLLVSIVGAALLLLFK